MAIVLPKFSRRRSPSDSCDSSQSSLSLTLCNADALYAAGAMMSIGVQLCGVDPSRIASSECSVLWFTEGKGDEDLGIAHFVRRPRGHWDSMIARRPDDGQWRIEDRIECRLPPTPLSYRGQIITIRWCVRLRFKLDVGKDVLGELPFHLVGPEQIECFRSPVNCDQADPQSVDV